MTPHRLLAAILATAAVVAACSPAVSDSTHEPASPTAGGNGSPGPTGPPNLGDLRVTTEGWRTDFTKANVDLGEIVGGGPPRDGIPAVDEPRFESIDAARSWLVDRSPVISLEVGGASRAYPLAILMWHEIVNDTLGGIPVVVTFCPLCNTALVFERELDGTLHDFGTTGNLRFSDLVMYDRQTESWWQQATGEAIVGELTGKRLTFLPAQIVSLAEFAAAHPDGDVLSRETGFRHDYGRNPYVGYDEAGDRPTLFSGVIDGRLAPRERVVTVGEGAEATALPFSELRKVGVAEVTIGQDPVVVFWVPGTASALDRPLIDEGEDVGATGVFRRVVEGRALTFERRGGEDAPITDRETGSTWSVTGQATSGPLAGTRLEPVIHGNHFWFAWAAFSPETSVWTAPPPGVPAAAWRTTQLVDVRTGETFRIADLRGKLVAIEPMATWCPSCRVQQTEAVAAIAALGSGDLFFVGLAVDPNERPADLAAYSEREGFDWPFAVAPVEVLRSLASEFGDQVLSPASTPLILVGPDGAVIEVHFGIRRAEELERLFRTHLPRG